MDEQKIRDVITDIYLATMLIGSYISLIVAIVSLVVALASQLESYTYVDVYAMLATWLVSMVSCIVCNRLYMMNGGGI